MRKLLSLIFAVTVIVASARQISPDEAAAIASDFLNSSSIQCAPGQLSVQRAKPAAHQAEAPFYIFNADDDRGFVIISGDDRVRKILGYSDNGTFDFNNLPPQLAALLEQYAKEIKTLPASAATDPSWASPVAAPTTTDGVLLETANWGQGYPYNAQCPFDLLQCPTGCCATAMAIIMQYHQWPKKTRGFHFSVETQELSNLADYIIDWDLLNKPIYDIENDENALNQISSLFRNIGESINTEYHFNASGSYAEFMYPSFFNCFKYSLPRYYQRADKMAELWDGISEEEWVALINEELFNNRPIIYISRLDEENQGSNHAYVVDGIDASGLYHVNWGWDGTDNGYFELWIKGSKPSVYQSIITNISPDYDATDDLAHAYIAPSQFEDVGWNVDYQNKYFIAPPGWANFDEPDGMYHGVLSGLVNPFDSEYEYAIAFVDKDFNILSLACRDVDIHRRQLERDGRGFYRSETSKWYIKAKGPNNAVGTSPVYRLTDSDTWKIIPSYGGSMNFSDLDGSTSKYTAVQWNIPSNVQFNRWNSTKETPILPDKILSNSLEEIVEANIDYGVGNFFCNGHKIEIDPLAPWPMVKFPYNYYREMRAEPINIEFRHSSNSEQKIINAGIWYIINTETGEARPTYNSYYSDYDNPRNYIIPEDNLVIPSSIIWEGKSYPVTEIGEHAFRMSIIGNSTNSITIPSSIRTIKDGAFNGSGIDNIIFEEGSQLKIIGDNAFTHFYVRQLELPEGIEEIGYNNFKFLNYWTLKLPKSLKSIKQGSFSAYSDITLIVQWDNPLDVSVESNCFDDLSNHQDKLNKKLLVPVGTKELYEAVEPWSSFEISEYQEPTLTLSDNYLELMLPESAKLTATLNPAYSDIKWTSSDKNVVVVSPGGEVCAVGYGSAVVTASASYDSSIAAQCLVCVPNITGISIIDKSNDNIVKIYDLMGRQLYSGAETTIPNLKKGIYLLRKGNTTKKICIK